MATKARIAINLLHIVHGNVGGSEEYSVETLRAFAESETKEIEPVIHASEAVSYTHLTLPTICSV